MLRAALVALASAAVALGCGGRSEGDGRAANRDKPAVHTRVVGGSDAQRALIREILAGMEETHIERIEIGEPEPAWKPFEPGDVAVTVAVRPNSGLLGGWAAVVVAGAFRDRSVREGLPSVVVLNTAGGGGRLDPGGTSKPRSVERGAVAAQIRRAAANAGTVPAELVVLEPYGIAYAMTLRVDDPARFMKERLPSLIEATDPFRDLYDGRYVEVVDATGDPIFRAGHATRLSLGGHWARADLAGCNPIIHSRPWDYDPPPCPA
jgi:hypothetical protein